MAAVRRRYVFSGLGLLLCASFFDTIRGPLLPVFSHHLGLPYERVSWFLVLGYLTSMAFGRVLISLVEAFGPRRMVLVLSLLAPLTAFYSRYVTNLGSLIFFGVLIAVFSSGLGSLSNLLVLRGTEPRHRSQYFGLLHMMFGMGSLLAPVVLGLFLSSGWDWRIIFAMGAAPILSLGLWVFLALPVDTPLPHERESKPFRFFSHQGLLLVTFAIYVGAEVLGSMWMITYLVEVRGFTVASAAPYATGFFLVMTFTRFACFLLVKSDALERTLIWGCLVAGLILFCVGLSGSSLALPFVGIVGPFFPLVLARLSRYFPQEAPALTLRILIAAQGTLALCNLCVGWLASTLGVAMAYHIPVVAYVLAIIGVGIYFRLERQVAEEV